MFRFDLKASANAVHYLEISFTFQTLAVFLCHPRFLHFNICAFQLWSASVTNVAMSNKILCYNLNIICYNFNSIRSSIKYNIRFQLQYLRHICHYILVVSDELKALHCNDLVTTPMENNNIRFRKSFSFDQNKPSFPVWSKLFAVKERKVAQISTIKDEVCNYLQIFVLFCRKKHVEFIFIQIVNIETNCESQFMTRQCVRLKPHIVITLNLKCDLWSGLWKLSQTNCSSQFVTEQSQSKQQPVVCPAEKHNITRTCHMWHTRDTGALSVIHSAIVRQCIG